MSAGKFCLPEVDHLAPAFLANPYPFYRLLRENAPVYRSVPLRRWLVSRYADIVAVLRDTRNFASDGVRREVPTEQRKTLTSFQELSARWLFFLDPPVHTRARARAQGPFTPRAVEGLAPLVQRIVDDLLNERSGKVDFVWDFAFPLPARVLAGLLCAPEEQVPFLGWCESIARAGADPLNQGARQRGAQAVADLTTYLQCRVASCRQRGEEGLISRLLQLRSGGPELITEEVTALCLLLVFAGNETTQHLLGNGLLALLEHPAEWARLLENRALFPTAVEELARFDPPVQGVSRFPRTEVELAGQRLCPGEEVVLLLGSANRDPERFADPDRLDLSRAPEHLAYGLGPHFCLGAALARLEVRLALDAIANRFPRVRLAGQVCWRDHNLVSRGLKTLPVILE